MTVMRGGSREGKQGLALVCALLFAALFASVALAAPGDLDPTFDGDGKRTINYGGSEDGGAVAVQPDGKIVLVSAGLGGFAVTRLNTDGSFDAGFGGGDGVAPVTFPNTAVPDAVALQPDGKILVIGSVSTGGTALDKDVAIARVNPDGSLDGGFDGDGRRTFGAANTNDGGRGIALRPDGRIVLTYDTAPMAGTSTTQAVVAMNADGSPDNTFGFLGGAIIDFPGAHDLAQDIAVQPDGKIVIVGTGFDAGTVNVARLQPGGLGDPDFDGDGKRTVAGGGGVSLALQSDGKLLVAGMVGASADHGVWRFNPDGSTDSGFGSNGSRVIDHDGIGEVAFAIALQANGKIIAAGSTSSGNDFAVARLQPGGELDTTFDFDGKKKIDFGGSDVAHGVALQSNGGIVVGGDSFINGARDISVARLNGDPPAAGGGPGGGGSAGKKAPRCQGKRATIVGTNRSERLRGTKKADVIVALGGNDRISGLRGSDRICAGKGKDRVSGGPGNDRIDGGAGNDILKGQGGKDKLTGGAGRDRMSGGAGRDNCSGGAGKDRATCEREKSA